jgi:hypothetical protein
VTIGLRFCEYFSWRDTAWPIVNDDLLAKPRRKSGGDHARSEISAPAYA